MSEWIMEINDRIALLNDQAVNPETGEIDEDALADIADLCVEAENAAEDLGVLIKMLEAQTAGIKAEKKALVDGFDSRIKQNDAKVARYKDILITARNGQNLVTDRVSIKFAKKRETLQLAKEDEDEVIRFCIDNEMFDCLKQKWELSRTELGNAVKAGTVVPHAAWGRTAGYTCSCK